MITCIYLCVLVRFCCQSTLQYFQVSAEEKDKICNLSLEELYLQLQDGRLKSVDVLHAYQKKVRSRIEIDLCLQFAKCDKIYFRYN